MGASVIVAGFGGQGLLFAGTVLARAAMAEGLEVFWIPSYGPEMRGGAAACTVIVDDLPIGSPVVDRADIVIALSGPALARYRGVLVPGSLLIVDGSQTAAPSIDGVEVIELPRTTLARTAVDDRLVSVVALGVLAARRPVVGSSAIREALQEVVGTKHPEALQADLDAFDAGMALVCSPEAGFGPTPLATGGGAWNS